MPKKLGIYTIGKAKELWLQKALSEYEKRLPFSIQWHLFKKDLILPASYAALDPSGMLYNSLEFANWFYTISPKAFVIGGPEGLTPLQKEQASSLISLSPLTFTHQMTRLILLEQLYRASQIHKGTRYHK